MGCYFDNSATTKPTQKVVDAMVEALTNNYGNPSSLHSKGDQAKDALDSARKTVAKFISADPSEIYFTSGGTESNNTAIFGTAAALKRRGNRIVTTNIEHPSVLEPMKRLEEQGFEVIRLEIKKDGCIDERELLEAINKDTILVSMMLVNNEIGSIQPIAAAARAIKKVGAPAYLHCDAVQGFGKLPINVSKLGVNFLTASAHKIHGPKGQGFLYIKKGTKIIPYIIGGGQEENIRSGTHPMPGICGLAAAIDGIDSIAKASERVLYLKNKVIQGMSDCDNFFVNSPENALPYILNVSLVGIPSEVLRNYLSDKGICVSTGSACSKGHRSVVLENLGLPANRIDSSIRISFSRFNTEEETIKLIDALKEANTKIRRN